VEDINMRYSMTTMRQALKDVGISKGVQPFLWEETKGQRVHPQLAAQFKYGHAGNNFVNDLLEYCWLAYSKASNAPGAMLIGRTGDLWVAEHLQRAGFTSTDKQKLWDPHTKGNIQVLDKWAPVVNDCWVLGGVHRFADFKLVSVRAMKNLWDFEKGFHVVTAREILGLLSFGYSFQEGSDGVKLTCTDQGKAQSATIGAYDTLMKGKEKMGVASVLTLMDPNLEKLHRAIEGFDRSTLKHVVPPK
jgi:hypothetical protein